MEEEKIIEEGLKTHTKSDKIYFAGMIIMFIFIFIPPIFRIVFFDPDKKPDTIEVSYLELTCSKAIYRDNYRFNTKIVNNYKEGAILDSFVEYTYENAPEDVVIPEINELLEVKEDGFEAKKLSNGYSFTMDFTKPALKELPIFKDATYISALQKNTYEKDGMVCEAITTIKEEKREE